MEEKLIKRRDILKNMATGIVGITVASTCGVGNLSWAKTDVSTAKDPSAARRPNVIFILTDDQGYADLKLHGNKDINTPNIDRLFEESVEFSKYYVCPVCAPTRASLMTGRYNIRTNVLDTWKARDCMSPDEVLLPEILQKNGYQTCILGKWHLGDHFPLRPQDRGFDESVVHLGGGLGGSALHPVSPKGSYFDPTLYHNGTPEKYHGYCMDIYADEAVKFIEENKAKPFFLYLATNTPHAPLMVSKEYSKPYLEKGLDERTAKLYGMISNIDDNLKKITDKLEELKLEDDTILVFMSDNGPDLQFTGEDRYTANLHGKKCETYDGGIRVPCSIRWPAKFSGNRKIDKIAAHIDFMPTILDACGIRIPSNLKLDGTSLMPLLLGDDKNWPDRTLFFQWHRGNRPGMYRSMAALTQKYKLVQPKYNAPVPENTQWQYNFELYDIDNDPFEKNELSAKYPQVLEKLKKEYELWFSDVCKGKSFEPFPVYIGSEHENPVLLRPVEQYYPENISYHFGKNADKKYWIVEVVEKGTYNFTVFCNTMKKAGEIHLRSKNFELVETLDKGTSHYTFESVKLPLGPNELGVWIKSGDEILMTRDVLIEKR